MNPYHSHVFDRLPRIRPEYFVGLAVLSSVVCAVSLRQNNLHMISLRERVYAADKNNTDVQKPLQDLQAYVTRHMNTDLSSGGTGVYPPIQLKYTYERLVRQQGDAAAAANTAVYTAAQQECERQNATDFSGRNRIPCIEAYVQSHKTSAAPVADSLYKFAFVSPRWSPDLAGWSMVVAVLSAVTAAITYIVRAINRRLS